MAFRLGLQLMQDGHKEQTTEMAASPRRQGIEELGTTGRQAVPAMHLLPSNNSGIGQYPSSIAGLRLQNPSMVVQSDFRKVNCDISLSRRGWKHSQRIPISQFNIIDHHRLAGYRQRSSVKSKQWKKTTMLPRQQRSKLLRDAERCWSVSSTRARWVVSRPRRPEPSWPCRYWSV